MNIFRIFKAIGSAILRALRFAEQRGLTDDVFDLAVHVVTEGQVRFDSPAERREWAVGVLVTKGLPESIARLAVEMAVQEYKRKVAGG